RFPSLAIRRNLARAHSPPRRINRRVNRSGKTRSTDRLPSLLFVKTPSVIFADVLPAILKKSVSSSGKQPPHAEKTALSRRSGSSRKTAPDPALPHNFLTGNAAEILSLWSEKISENGGSPSPQILKTVLAQFSLLLKPGSPATADSIS